MTLTTSERELLLTEHAAVRSENSDHGSGVVLVPSGKTLCACEPEHARLITKLFNAGLKLDGDA